MAVQCTRITLTAAAPPWENPLPPLEPRLNSSSQANHGDLPPDPSREALLRGASAVLPYLNQDGYDRALGEREFDAIVVENRWLRAVFLPELGGRLWSLLHKPTGLNLVWTNPVIQYANFAVRDAWFAGGIEWNVGILGHSPFTCAPLFAGLVHLPDGTPVLRMWEWERIRCVAWQIDVILPDDSPFLYVRPRIVNPNDHEVLMYWWSNVAVPEREDVRILAPADRAKRHDYDERLVEHDMPHTEGVDATYPARREWARDMYMLVPPNTRPWVASLDGSGRGLVVASSSRSIGRKAFNWGKSAGGQTWQRYLSQPGEAYYEIQAGLTSTQTEYTVMPAEANWEWLEVYGLLEADADVAHSQEWKKAYGAVQNALDNALPQAQIESMLQETAEVARQPPESLLHQADGWGALEIERRRHAGQPIDWAAATPFAPAAMGDPQRPWLGLLREGFLAERDTRDEPLTPMVQSEWHTLLDMSLRHKRADHWLTWYQLGIARFHAGDRDGAAQAWTTSLARTPSGWAHRNLAVMARLAGDLDMAIDRYRQALRLLPDMPALAMEYLEALLDADQPAEALDLARSLDARVVNGRIALLSAQAALKQDDLDSVEAFFKRRVEVANIREGETTTSDLWFALQERRLIESGMRLNGKALREYVRKHLPVPEGMDFRPATD